jgi:hypothetical protein
VERETGFEPATSGLEGQRSTTELLPLDFDRGSTAKGSQSMAVRTDDIALGDLGEEFGR